MSVCVGAAAENPETATSSPAAHVQAPPAPETVGRNRAQAESEYGTDVFCRVILPVLFQSGAGQGFSCAGLRLLMLAVMMTMAMAMVGNGNGVALLAHPNATLWAILRPPSGSPGRLFRPLVIVCSQEEAEPGWHGSLVCSLFVRFPPPASWFHGFTTDSGGGASELTVADSHMIFHLFPV